MALLGFGSPYDDKMTSLLGIDPSAARQQALWNGIAQMGAALMGTRNMGLVGGAFLNGINKGKEDYLANAYDAYRIKTAADDKAYQRGRDAVADKQWQTTFDYNKSRQSKADARDAYTFGQQVEADQRAADLRTGRETAVNNWMQPFQQQGGTIPFSPGVRSIAQQGGLQGADLTDVWRYNQMKPALDAGDYETAYTGLSAVPDVKAPTVQSIYGPDGQEQKVQWDSANQKWSPIGGQKAPSNSSGITVSPDGTVTVGGKMTADDKRANALATQIMGQEPALMSGFETLANPQNYAGSKVPGGALVMSSEAQIAQDAITNTVANWLYLTSGATATDAEIERQTAMVTPTPMDSPQRVAAKKARLKSIFDTMRSRGGVPTAPEQPQAETQQNQPDPANPQPGDVVLGYRFKGGNRRDPNNWEKVQ